MAKESIAPKSEEVKFLFQRSERRKAELVRLYDRLIASARSKNRVYDSRVYENHHIIPRSLGGPDDSSNIVILTFDEHFLAHYLLALTTTGSGKYLMLSALWGMSGVAHTHGSRKPTRRQYALSRAALIEAVSSPENGALTSAGMSRWKDEIGEEAYSLHYAAVGAATAAYYAWFKIAKPEDFASWCSSFSTLEHGVVTSEGMARWRTDRPEEYALWRASRSSPEHTASVVAGMARWKKENPEEYSLWLAGLSSPERGAAVSSGISRWKIERPEEYAVWLASKSSPEASAAISAGQNRRKIEMGLEEYVAWNAARIAKSVATKLKDSPTVRCLNDGSIHQHAVAAAKVYGLNSHAIHRVCRGERKHTGGYRFEYV